MKLEVGMYVRTKCGIAKITDIICGQDVKFDNENIFEDNDDKTHHMYDGISKNDYFFQHEIVGEPSFDIIDLVREGDYVNGEKVIALKKDISERNIHFNSKKCNIFTDYSLAENWYFGIEDKDIKSIVTKEQYKNIEYRIGE
jgi:hypothetical protein